MDIEQARFNMIEQQIRPWNVSDNTVLEVLHSLRTPDRLEQAAQGLRERLDACRAAATTVYAHFEENGISVGLVFRLRQLRERILRVVRLAADLGATTAVLAAQDVASTLIAYAREHNLSRLVMGRSHRRWRRRGALRRRVGPIPRQWRTALQPARARAVR